MCVGGGALQLGDVPNIDPICSAFDVVILICKYYIVPNLKESGAYA